MLNPTEGELLPSDHSRGPQHWQQLGKVLLQPGLPTQAANRQSAFMKDFEQAVNQQIVFMRDSGLAANQ